MASVESAQMPVTFEEVAVYFTQGQGALLDFRQRALYRDVMQENYETVTSLGFSISKPDLIAQLERGEEPWLPDYQACKEKEISEVSHTGEDLVSDSEVGNQHQEGPGEVESQRNFLRRADGNCSHCLEEGEDGGNQQRSERLLGNHLWKKVDDSIKYGGRFKDLEETTAQQTDPKEPYECLKCGKRFLLRLHLIIHQTVHMGEKPLQQLDCGKQFSNSSDCNKHGRNQCLEEGEHGGYQQKSERLTGNHLKKKVDESIKCDGRFKDLEETTAQQTDPKEPYECRECGKRFILRLHLIIHQTVHMGEKPFQWLDCGKSFSNSSDLNKYGRSQCLEEGKGRGNQQRSERLLGNHLRKKVEKSIKCRGRFKDIKETTAELTNPKEPYECLECGKRFILKSQLITHQTVHKGEKPLQWLDCEKRFSNSSDLKHGGTHVGEKPNKCFKCGKHFKWKSALIIHERIHTGERPHKCVGCEKSFTQSSSLIRHQAVHTEGKPHKCLDCEKSFRNTLALVTHQAIHTGEKPHKCLDCEKSFTHRSSLIRHQAMHREGGPHKCLDCGKSFRKRSALVTHQAIHTGESP